MQHFNMPNITNPPGSHQSHLSVPIFKVGVATPVSQIVCAKGRALGLSGLWRLVFLLVLETLELHPSFQRTQLSAGGDGGQGGPFRCDPAPRWPLSCSVGLGSQWQRQVGRGGGGGGRGTREPGTFLAPVQGRCGLGAGLEHRESLWAPPLTPHPTQDGYR